ncbi:MAG: hypothetical protein Q4F72_09940 [Desulfovibrionaceae bacterium]|nr:hypothetical protein [Desulfovibrionaceae bacterium]
MSHASDKFVTAAVCLLLLCLAQWGCSSKNETPPPLPPDYASRPDWYPLRPDYRKAAQRVFDACFVDDDIYAYRSVVDPLEPEPYVTRKGRFLWRGMAVVTCKSSEMKSDGLDEVYYYYVTRKGIHIEDAYNGSVEFGKALLSIATLTIIEHTDDAFVTEFSRAREIKERAEQAKKDPTRSWKRENAASSMTSRP